MTKSGKLRALATLAPARAAGLPNVPTAAEAGYPQLEAVLWYMMLAPAGAPQAVVSRVNQAFTKLVAARDTRERLAGVGGGAHEQHARRGGGIPQKRDRAVGEGRHRIRRQGRVTWHGNRWGTGVNGRLPGN